jgi:hypothetical protein
MAAKRQLAAYTWFNGYREAKVRSAYYQKKRYASSGIARLT